MSVLLFSAQVVAVPARANVIEGAVLAELLAAPMYAIIAAALAALADDLPALSFQSVALHCRAILLHFAMIAVELEVHDARLAQAQESDDALVSPPSHDWISDVVLE